MSKLFKKVYLFLRSIKLAIVLIIYGVLFSIIVTLIPQGHEIAFYKRSYPFFSGFILFFGFDNFYKSLLFFFPLLLFYINLFVCAFDRIYRRFKNRSTKRYGPDLIHVGLLILIVAGVITLVSRREQLTFLRKGESTRITKDYDLLLKDYEYLTYDNGRPKDWISTVEIFKNGKSIKQNTIEVNKPLKVGSMRIYQDSYETVYKALLKNRNGDTHEIKSGDIFRIGDLVFLYLGNEKGPGDEGGSINKEYALFRDQTSSKNDIYKANINDSIGSYKIVDLTKNEKTGLKIVVDPGVNVFFISLVFIGLGLVLTLIQKMGENKL